MPISYQDLLDGGYDRETLDRIIAEYDARRAAREPAEPAKVRRKRLPLPTPACHPLLVSATCGPGWWQCVIEGWAPCSKNLYHEGIWLWAAGRKADNAAVALWRDHPDGPPKAICRRRFTCHIVRKMVCGVLGDAQNREESIYDSLKMCGIIVDDSSKWLERGETTLEKSRKVTAEWETTLRVEDVSA